MRARGRWRLVAALLAAGIGGVYLGHAGAIHAKAWLGQDGPVMLVHRCADGYIQWMDVSAWLRTASAGRKTPVRRIVFAGQPFTALSLHRLRDRVLGGPSAG